MPRRLLASVVLCTLACFGMLGLALGLGWSPKLGLDLEGGLSVVYAPNKHVQQATLDNVTSIIEQRINALGVSQPNVTTQGPNIVVQLPGVKDPSKVLAIIGETAQLYIRPVLCIAPPYVAPKDKSTIPKGPPPTCPTSNQVSSSNPQPALYPGYENYPTTTAGEDAAAAYEERSIVPVETEPRPKRPSGDYVLGPSTVNGKLVTGTIFKSTYPQLETSAEHVGGRRSRSRRPERRSSTTSRTSTTTPR